MNQLVELSIQLASSPLEDTVSHKFHTALRDSLVNENGFSLSVANHVIGMINVNLYNFEISELDLAIAAGNFAQFINNLRLYCDKYFDSTTFWNKLSEIKIEVS